jgi:hypothetical protein
MSYFGNGENWYWVVDGDASTVFSSAKQTYVPVTDADYVAWLKEGNVPSAVDANGMLLWRISNLEQKQTPRRLREALSGTDNGWLKALTASIEALRAQLT